MKQDFTSVINIYIICGKTDMRKGIDGLATLIQETKGRFSRFHNFLHFR